VPSNRNRLHNRRAVDERTCEARAGLIVAIVVAGIWKLVLLIAAAFSK
jgi:hypothetical protein